MKTIELQTGLPCSEDAERLVLGSILLDGSRYAEVASIIKPEIFHITSHRAIWARMAELAERGETIDRVTIANELIRYKELESVGGLSYLISLDDNMPVISNLDAYIRILIEKWRLRKTAFIAQKTMNDALLGELTADQISQDAQSALASGVGGYGSSQVESVSSYIDNYPGGINTMLDAAKWDRGILTGFTQIDDWTDGFHAQEIFLVAARPSHGKTAFAVNVAKRIARTGVRVVFFSLEMSKKMILDRMVCDDAWLSLTKFRKGDLNEQERGRLRTAANNIRELPIWIDDTQGLRVGDMRVKLQTVERDGPVGLVIVDYVQLLKTPKGRRYNSENDRFTDIAEELKTLTKATGKPLLLLSQLNRDSEKASGEIKPRLSQARGAGAWEEIANVGAVLYREYLRRRDRMDLKDIAEFICEKNRSGPVGIARLRYIDWLMRFEDLPEAA